MCKKYFFKIIITVTYFSCITLPEKPINESNECYAYYYPTKKQIKEIPRRHWTATYIISHASASLAFGIGFAGLAPLGTLPFLQYTNFKKTERIKENLIQEHCNEL